MTQWHVSLMEFVEHRVGNSNQKRQQRPIEPPAGSGPAKSAKYRNAEHGEFRNMREFANAGVQMKEVSPRSIGQEPVKNGEDDPAGFLRREIVRGKNRNDRRGDHRGNPILDPCPSEDFVRFSVFH